MIFDAPAFLLAAPPIAVAAGVGAWLGRRRRIRLAGRWSEELRAKARANGRWGPLGIGCVVLLLGIAFAGPRGGRTEVTTETQALSMVIAMDVSRSMLAEDVAPSRLRRAVREARRMVHDLTGDRIGLIAFAGRSYILAPLTIDGAAITLQLDALSPDLASQGGTSLAAALRQGGQLLAASTEVADRVLVVFTDGETHDSIDAAIAAASALKRDNVRVVLVAQGTPKGARIPVRDSAGTLLQYQETRDGEIIQTARNDSVLATLADAAAGSIIPAELPDQAGAIHDLTAAFKRNPTTETRTADLTPLGWIPLLAAALLLLAQTVARRTAALIALAALVAPSVARAQGVPEGERALRREDPGKAATLFGKAADEGEAPDTNWYNAGTAALLAGDLKSGNESLRRAVEALDPDLRYRVLYNLGVAALREARADSAHAEALYGAAIDHLKNALLLRPGSSRAKWNLELALQNRPPSSGGGGGGGQPPPPQPQPQPQAPPQPQSGSLSQSQAEQILNSVEREERSTRAQQMERLRQRSAGGDKDW